MLQKVEQSPKWEQRGRINWPFQNKHQLISESFIFSAKVEEKNVFG
jgi:hypothetical protein